MPEPVEAVLFDFSGTLMVTGPPDRRLAALLEDAGIELTEAEVHEWARRLERSGGLPGGHSSAVIPEEIRATWERRDLEPAAHRRSYTWLIRHAGWPWPELADAVYDGCTRPDAWTPYPDTLPTLRALKEHGVRTAVVSNVGWDPRPVLAAHGVADLFDAILLSYEEGHCKPDPVLFKTACARLDTDPGRALMVGDDRRADGGAEAVGIHTFYVDPLPARERLDGFAPLLAEALSRTPRRDAPAG
ncbi:HAD family hydrolase [Actinoallomurus iriomotensis]|uniref:HAD family hydrolase n=1 Tax=Actinoallomurus iriomotensis TaxID=478107 RepID=UPI0025539694|nr:HAD family hydrolase [Actinoallomurus iriomotensis]